MSVTGTIESYFPQTVISIYITGISWKPTMCLCTVLFAREMEMNTADPVTSIMEHLVKEANRT